MRYLIIVKATANTEAGVMPTEAALAEMGAFHEELARAGVLLDGTGLAPTREGWRVHYDGDEHRVIDGPFSETKELIAGYTLIQVRSREEAVEWTRRFPNPAGPGVRTHIEVRRLFELDDFGPSEAVDRMRELDGKLG